MSRTIQRQRSAASHPTTPPAAANTNRKYGSSAALHSPSYVPSHISSPSSSFGAASSSSWNPISSFTTFRSQAPLLYDVCSSYGLLWPSLSTQWLVRDPYLLLESPHRPPDDSSIHAYEMLIGTHTSGQCQSTRTTLEPLLLDTDNIGVTKCAANCVSCLIGLIFGTDPNSITLGHIRIPNKTAFDPLQEFLKHPIVAPHQQQSHSTPLSHNVSSSSTGAPAHTSNPSSTSENEKEYLPYPISQYGSVSIKTVNKIRTNHEIHRIRPLHAPYLTQQMHGTVSTSSLATDSTDMTDVPASSKPPARHPYGPNTLAAVKSPDSHLIVYKIPTKPWLSEVNNSKSVGKGGHTSRLVSLKGLSTGGWSVDWNYCPGSEPGTFILSGDDNGNICVWNLNDSESKNIDKTIQNYIQARQTWHHGHASAINDMSWFKCSHPNNFTSVGDDLMLKVWDIRSQEVCAAIQAHEQEVTSLSTSAFRSSDILTASKDGTVKLWDIRQMKEFSPVHTFTGHGDGVLQVSFAPFDYHGGSIFASSSSDRRIFIWDSSLIGSEIDQAELQESGPPELMFVHAGHTDSIEDFSWHPTHPWLLSSVSADNVLQIWEMFEGIHAPIDSRDLPTMRAIDRILQKPSPSHDERHPFVPFDLFKCMKAIPDELYSELFNSTTVAPLKQSPALPFATSFIKNYSTNIDAQLKQMNRTEAQMMGDVLWNEGEDICMPVEDDSSERSSLSNTRPSTVLKQRKELSETPHVSIKLKSISAESSPNKYNPHTPQSTRVKQHVETPSSGRTPAKRAPSMPIPPELLEEIRSLRHWHQQARLLSSRTSSGRVASQEAELALQKVLEFVSEEEESDSNSSASEQERKRTRRSARTRIDSNPSAAAIASVSSDSNPPSNPTSTNKRPSTTSEADESAFKKSRTSSNLEFANGEESKENKTLEPSNNSTTNRS